MTKFFFLVSGEHEALPFAEVMSIFEAEGLPYRVIETLDQVIRLDVNPESVEIVRRRAAMTRLIAQELSVAEAKSDKIAEAIEAGSTKGIIRDRETFAVRVRRIRDYDKSVGTVKLERDIGKLLVERNPGAKVDLKKPSKTFFGVLTQSRFVFGLKVAEIVGKPFVDRRPRRRPFFHPSALQAKLARCMVNLAQPKHGELVVDPFCGTGTVLVEASLIGCRALGLDVQRRMTRGAMRNIRHYGVDIDGLVVADVKCLPFSSADCLVTDPPYGISSTTLKRTSPLVIKEFLVSAHDVLRRGSRICLAAPKTLRICSIATDLGYKHLESHLVYVHRSLTREIIVLERV